MFKKLSAIVVLTLIAQSAALAKEPIFVTPDQSQATLILLDPPAEGSDVQKAELAQLHEIEKSRTPARVEQAISDAENENIFVFKTVLGDKFNEAELPLTSALAKRVANDEAPTATAAKSLFHRMHPYAVDKTLNPVCKTKTKDDSYPSGHTTVGWLLGLTLVEMIPEKREAILERAQDYGVSRLVCGVHYPSDIAASRALATAVHAVMAQNPQYKQELAAAKAELRKHLGLDETAAAEKK